MAEAGSVPRVGFQGALGAYSEEAVRALVPEADPVPCQTFEAVVRAVDSGELRAGVLPVENSLAGTVAEAFEALASGEAEVTAEVAIPIRHCLWGVEGATVSGLREARSHPVALSQCRGFFAEHPGIRAQAVYDTAGAAEQVASLVDPGLAAIASRRAGERYGLELLRADLQDRDDNQTRFYLIERAGSETVGATPGGSATVDGAAGLKTSCLAELENRPGALHELVGVFSTRGLDLTHVTSRPGASPWTYRFIIEFRHGDVDVGRQALAAAGDLCTSLRVFGTFMAWRPQADTPGTKGR